MTFQTRNPATGEVIQTYQHLEWANAQVKINTAWESYQKWRDVPIEQRAQAVAQWAKNLRQNKDQLARMMTKEMGKPITQSFAEIEKSAATLDFLVTNGPKWLATNKIEMEKGGGEIVYEPVGPVLAIMPWNFPLWQIIRFAGPGIIAGNTILMKHADITAGCAEIIAKTAQGIAPGFELLQDFMVDHETASKAIAHKKIRGVTFTGSTRGGREVAEQAAKNLKKSVLELGGSDAYLVFQDADIKKSAEICAAGRLTNGGQSCVAAKRFFVDRSISEQWLKIFNEQMRQSTPADPRDSNTKLGPMATKKFQETLTKQLEDLKNKGGQVLTGGEALPGAGAYFAPTTILFQGPQEGLGDIEVFGPVAIVILVDSEDEAITAANDSPFGLGGAIFTNDLQKAKKYAHKMESGFVAINDMVQSNVRLPFGGVKDSGWGRELSPHGILEFTNIQAHYIGSTK